MKKKKSTNPKSSFSSSRAEFKESWEDFPGILVAKIPCFQCRGPEVLMQRTRSHMLQLRVYMLNLKISCASTKTRHGQRNIFFFFFKERGLGIFLQQRDNSLYSRLVYHWPNMGRSRVSPIGPSPQLAESSAPVRSSAVAGRRWSPGELTQD